MNAMLEVVFSDHALMRVARRFSNEGWRKIPYERIQSVASRNPPAGKFKVRVGGVTYVCIRTGDKILVLTVFRTRSNAR